MHPVHHGRTGDHVPGDGAELAGQRPEGRSLEDPHRDSDLRGGAAAGLQIKKEPRRRRGSSRDLSTGPLSPSWPRPKP